MQKEITHLPVPQITEQEIVDIAWDVWNVTGRLDYISESAYEVLVKNSLIVLSIEEKHQLMSAANVYLQDQEERSFFPYSPSDEKENQKRYAKKIAVARLFQKYKDEGVKIILP